MVSGAKSVHSLNTRRYVKTIGCLGLGRGIMNTGVETSVKTGMNTGVKTGRKSVRRVGRESRRGFRVKFCTHRFRS